MLQGNKPVDVFVVSVYVEKYLRNADGDLIPVVDNVLEDCVLREFSTEDEAMKYAHSIHPKIETTV